MEEVKKPTTTQKVKVYEGLLKELVQCNESLNYVKMESLLRKAYHYFESIENPKHKGKRALKEEVTLFNQLKQT
tara:strand:+ start:218 stop:439 length:222 start_codon:yes stop_codon:yes gene_type:complete